MWEIVSNFVAFLGNLNFTGGVELLRAILQNYGLIFMKLKKYIYILDAVGSWQIILPMPNLDRPY